MGHGLGVVDALVGLPDVVVVFFVLVTLVGGVGGYLFVLTVAYALGPVFPGVGNALTRDRVAFVVAVALGAVAITAGLKHAFAHPRPPGAATAPELAWLPAALAPLWDRAATADGFSLPSGHATGSAAVYGAAALVIDHGRRRTRYAVACFCVLAIAASRLVIGVHYLGDVLVGLVAGGGYLAVVWLATSGKRVKRAFSLAVIVALAGAAVTFSVETLAALGGALGGRIGWTLVGGRLPTATPRTGTVAALFGLGIGGGLITAALATDSAVVGFLATGVGVATVLAAPVAADRLV
jgi:membrane-associated phospholipid phosphatase